MSYPQSYFEGRKAQAAGKPRNPPGYLSWEGRHWWLAGWSDADNETKGEGA